MGKTAWFKRILQDSRKPTAAVSRSRFVDNKGDQLTVAATRAFGVAQDAHSAEDVTDARELAVTILGIEEVEVGAATAVGPLTNDSSGRAVDAVAGDPVNAYGLETGGALGDRVPALIICWQGKAPADLVHTVGTADGTIDDVGGAFSQATLNNNFKELSTRVNQILKMLR